MPDTYALIQTVTVTGSTAATIDFTSIPATYTDLILKLSTRTNHATNGDSAYIRFNGVTTGYNTRRLQGDGTQAYSANATEILFATTAANDSANQFSNVNVYITGYTTSNAKAISFSGGSPNKGATSGYVRVGAAAWTGTGVISSISVIPNNGSFVQYSMASLYGIKNS
jgi:hypothetical protein